MRAGRVLLASATVHAALFGALSRISIEGKHVTPVAPPGVSVVSPPPEPAVFDVVVLDSPASQAVATTTAPPAIGRAVQTGVTRRRAGQQVAASAMSSSTASATTSATTSATPPEADGQGHGHGQGHGMMGMRGVDLGIAAGTADRIIATSRPLAAEPKISGELHDAPGGRAIHDDAVTTMNVDADGTAHFHDKPDIDIKLKLPIPHLDVEGMREDLGKVLTDWYRDPEANKKFGPKGMVSRVILAVPGSCDSWGDVWCDDALAPGQEQYAREQAKTEGSLFGGKLDITSYLHRKLIGDPYSSRKLKLLDDTRDERVARGTKFKNQQLARSAEIAMRNLAGVVDSMSLADKKQTLFELWDECAEGDAPEGQAGQRVRALVLGYIRSHLPAGSPSAYTAGEIAAFSAKRTSKQAFAPYQAEPEELEVHQTVVPDEH